MSNPTTTESCTRCGTPLAGNEPTWPLCAPCNDHYVRTGESNPTPLSVLVLRALGTSARTALELAELVHAELAVVLGVLVTLQRDGLVRWWPGGHYQRIEHGEVCS